MDTNPYASPHSEPAVGQPNSKIEYRVFTGPFASFRLSRGNFRYEIRQKAQEAIEHEIGVSNVVSILEHPPSMLRGFEVVVWYHPAQ